MISHSGDPAVENYLVVRADSRKEDSHSRAGLSVRDCAQSGERRASMRDADPDCGSGRPWVLRCDMAAKKTEIGGLLL